MANCKSTARAPRSRSAPQVVSPRNRTNVALPLSFSRFTTEEPTIRARDWISVAGLVVSVVGLSIVTGIRVFVLAYFVRDAGLLQGVRDAVGLPLRAALLTVPLSEIERRLASDVTSGRRDDLREAAAQIVASQGAGVADVVISNDRPVAVVAWELMTFLGWL